MNTYTHCAKIVDGIVVDFIACADISMVEERNNNWLPVFDSNYCGIGWTWDGEKFLPPEIEEVQDEIN